MPKMEDFHRKSQFRMTYWGTPIPIVTFKISPRTSNLILKKSFRAAYFEYSRDVERVILNTSGLF